MRTIRYPGSLLAEKALPPSGDLIFVPGTTNNGNALFGETCANAIYLGTSGDVHVIGPDGGSPVIHKNMAAGVWIAMPPMLHINNGASLNIVIGRTGG